MQYAKQRFKLKLGVVAFSLLASMPSQAWYTYFMVDPLNLTENLAGDYADIQNRITEELRNEALRMLKKELQEATGVAKMAESASKQISNERLEKSIRDHEVAEQNSPLPSICQSATVLQADGTQKTYPSKNSVLSFSINHRNLCDITEAITRATGEDALQASMTSTTSRKEDNYITLIERETDEANGITFSDFSPVERILVGNKGTSGLSEEEYNQTLTDLSVIFPYDGMEDRKDYNPDSLINDPKVISKTMHSSIPYQAMANQLSYKLKAEDTAYSELENMELVSDDFYNEDNIQRYAHKNMLTPSQITREKALMKAFLVHQAVEKFKTSLHQETVLASRLQNKIENKH